MLEGATLTSTIITFACSCLSLTGSILIILSYAVARTRSTPKSAYLILHLAASDFFWFLSGSVLSTLWLFNNGSVPTGLCYLASPTISFTRMASLIWTVVISFNVLMSVQKRKWFWKSQEQAWEAYRKIYFAIIFVLATPGTLLSIIKQHTGGQDSESLGCSPGYEPIGLWYEVFFTELLPITIGFICNMYVFFTVRRKMSKSAFPQSVRKRRKRVMYHYIIVCILCWIPTILQYVLEIAGFHSQMVEIVARTSLYASGFLNFLVFGMQDPHLKRSFDLMIHYCGCAFCCIVLGLATPNSLKSSDVEKMVMFEEKTIVRNADLAKDKKSIYRNRKLSREDKISLYKERPDLNPRFKCAPAPQRKLSGTGRPPRISDVSSSSVSQMEEPLLENQQLLSPNDGNSDNGSYDVESVSNDGSSESGSNNGGFEEGEGEVEGGEGYVSDDSVSQHDYSSLSDTVVSNVLHDGSHADAGGDGDEENGGGNVIFAQPTDALLGNTNKSKPTDIRREGKPRPHQHRYGPDQGEQQGDDSSSDDEGDQEDEDLNAL